MERRIALVLFVLGVVTRLPFQSQILYHWDSVNYALATRRFDVGLSQPHVPGYIVYVGLGRLLNAVTLDPQTSFVWLSLIASGIAAVMVFYLGCLLLGRTVGVVAALLLLTDPLFWFYGEVALPHALDMALLLCVVFLLYQALTQHPRYLFLAALVLALAGGVRQQMLILLAPLYALVAWKAGIRYALPATALLILTCLVWFVPLLWLNGGLGRYLEILVAFNLSFERSTSVFLGAGWQGLWHNLDRLIRYTAYGWGLAVLPLLIYLVSHWRDWSAIWKTDQARFMTLWAMPSLLFYTLIHMGQQGWIFVYLPILLLLSAKALVWLLRSERAHKVVAPALLILILAGNVWLFLLAPESLGGVKVLNWSTIKDLDNHYLSFIREVRKQFSPRDTVILTMNWRHLSYYLPEYRVLAAPAPADAGGTNLDAETLFHPSASVNVILFDSPTLQGASSNVKVMTAREGALAFFVLQPPDRLVYRSGVVRLERAEH